MSLFPMLWSMRVVFVIDRVQIEAFIFVAWLADEEIIAVSVSAVIGL